MSLWLTLIWAVCAAVYVGVYAFCRKKMADISGEVAEEINNRVRKVFKAEHDAEARLFESFESFGDPTEAVRAYQKTLADTFSCPQANSAWNWTREDVELWRGRALREASGSRCRPTLMTAVIIVLAVTIGAALVTTITLNTVKPISAVAMQTSANGTPIGAAGPLPAPVSLPLQTMQSAGPPVLPTAYTPAPTNNAVDTQGFLSNGGDSIRSNRDAVRSASPPTPVVDTNVFDSFGPDDSAPDANEDPNRIADCNGPQSLVSRMERTQDYER